MKLPTDADLKERARGIVEKMAALGRVAYAIPASTSRAAVDAAIEAAGLVRRESDAETNVTRFTDDAGADSIVIVDRDDLGVRIFEARGPGVVDRTAAILQSVPFVPQSKLLREAIDPASPDSSKALLVLAHMVVAWDDDWTDLFLLHLASPDPIARNVAVTATFLASMCADAREPAIALLREASAREKFPKLKESIDEAIGKLTQSG